VLICTQCRNARWVCEAHPQRPWGDVEGACNLCGCGMPCPKCNAGDGLEPPEMAPGFVEDGGKRQ
jgi:hypothetical protein